METYPLNSFRQASNKNTKFMFRKTAFVKYRFRCYYPEKV